MRVGSGVLCLLLALSLGGCGSEIDCGECGGASDARGGGGGPDGPGNPGAPDAPAPSGLTADELALFNAMNQVRQDMGLPLLGTQDHLMCAARRHANDVGPAGSCSHTGTDGSSPTERAADCGGGWTGEIIACGQTSAQQAIQSWLGSPGHRAILTDPGNVHVGVAMNSNYWVGIFNR